jgi:hypothetical protein
MLKLLECTAAHRTTTITQYVELDGFSYYDGFDRAVVKLQNDDKWWIIPNDPFDDYDCDDVGPYDTPEDALMMLKLSFERS